MRFETTVAAFASALANPGAPPPAETRGRRGAPDVRRFAVYRNNVAVGLIGAIEARYPIVRRMIGPNRFRALARDFIMAEKPSSPVLIHYGQGFPTFLRAQVGDPAIIDVARFENAWVDAYHAAEGAVASVDDLAALEPSALADMGVALHPAARLLAFATPAASLWAAHQEDAEPTAPPADRREAALVTRPHADVCVRILPPSGFAFAERLANGATLAEAATALDDPAEFGTLLVGLVLAGAVSSIGPE